MAGPHHICILYVATAGLQGALMGSDEQEIVLLIYVIVDVIQNKVSHFYFGFITIYFLYCRYFYVLIYY